MIDPDCVPFRRRLPDRRGLDLYDFWHDGTTYTGGAGWFDDGRLAEIWLNAQKPNSAIDNQASDAAVLASRLLQSGASIEDIRHSLRSHPDGSAAGPIGALLDLIARAE
jgi:hypothetical protein